MNYRVILHTVGRIAQIESVLLVPSLVVSLLYYEWLSAAAFAATAVLALVLGTVLAHITRSGDRRIFARGGFVSVALSWIVLSLIGALPFVISGEIPSYIDALFETVSGFTTTGSSILPQPELLSHGMLFWRSFTHWVGGMGIIVFMMAILPAESGRSIHILRAEMPGPTMGKLVPRLSDTAKVLYLIYVFLTAVQIVLLLCGGMSLFDSVTLSLGTAGTGGFAISSAGLGVYSPYSQWVITVFMLIFGVNFNVYQLLCMRRFRSALRSTEMWCYFGIVAVSVTLITLNIASAYGITDGVRHAAFQVASIITTTGYSTVDFNLWPELSRTVLVLLMFIGGCAGSTAGGLKISRAMMLCKTVARDLRRMLHPRSVNAVRMEGKTVDEQVLSGVSAYFALYMLCIAAVFLLLSWEPFSLETNLTAAITCFNNVGPGLGAVGPAGSFAGYSDGATLLLSLAMLFGRLEIYPLIVLFSPSTWSVKRK